MARAYTQRLDLFALAAWVGLVATGLIAIYSTTHGPAAAFAPEGTGNNFQRQLMWAGLCIVGLAIALTIPVRYYRHLAFPAYVVSILLLIASLVIGVEVNGAKSWIALGPVRLQVAEIAKVGTVLAVAQLLSERRINKARKVNAALQAVGLLLLPAVLILMQNDTGTALVFLGLVPVVLFWSGMPLYIIALILSPAVTGYIALLSPPVALGFGLVFTGGLYWYTRQRYVTALAALLTGGVAASLSVLMTYVFQPHQVARLVSFTNPEAEQWRQGVGFHLVQSKAAIGSGGLWGKGFMQGTQTQGAYVPEQSTDFIFSVIAEEFGFVGSVVLLALFAALLLRLIHLGSKVKHPFGSMVAAGTVGVYLIHIFVNIGMATGLLPVIGIPLPFVSYGGSALVANTAMLAIVLNTHMRRDDLSIYGY
ncbi:rod shape-determining protein RodA [Salisaeta longa]|uniref:rod shape-determining protein RodA n=1 Tax=Salisaeta longa TaxID=503170 RepID=UPI0003B3EA01|nr:rod shape-determining protein RodA [Salisaeta longa]